MVEVYSQAHEEKPVYFSFVKPKTFILKSSWCLWMEGWIDLADLKEALAEDKRKHANDAHQLKPH